MNNRLLILRKKIKSRKPVYMMQDSHVHKRLDRKWKKPRGKDSKIRRNLRGYGKRVQIGYNSPREVRGMHSSGLMPFPIENIADLDKIDTKTQIAVISSTIGRRKLREILLKAQKMSIQIANFKIEDGIKRIDDYLKARKEEKKEKEKRKEEQKKEKKPKKDKLAEKVLSEEEKALSDKKEKDKLLTKTDVK